MSLLDIKEIENCISQIPGVKNVSSFARNGLVVSGKVEISLDGLDRPLGFDVNIYAQYPFQRYDSESIKFINKDLMEYNHVMGDGSICIHTSHSINLSDKLQKDFDSLKNWIVRYYIRADDDANYEHIIVPVRTIRESYDAFLFTETNYEFKKGDFGAITLLRMNPGWFKNKPIANHLVQSFQLLSGEEYQCKWSERYRNAKPTHGGLFAYVERAPAHLKRFAVPRWSDLGNLLNPRVLESLHNFETRSKAKQKGDPIPLLLGYRTVRSEIHWQATILTIGKFPLVGVPERIKGRKTGKWVSSLTADEISWAMSRDCSYDYFFGRGTLEKEILDKKILILGVGAIGSIVATTLARGGCRFIDLADYDVKEPENICRSEYIFDTGLSDKKTELAGILTSISPFVEVAAIKGDFFEDLIKIFHGDRDAKEAFESLLNEYDLILDCTTDNDLMYVLDSLDLNCDLINLSITNHARELVCAFYPNIYRFVINQYTNILENDIDDLYSPIGCWSPTFRASYNDINALVQTAVKNISLRYGRPGGKNNLVFRTRQDGLFRIDVTEY